MELSENDFVSVDKMVNYHYLDLIDYGSFGDIFKVKCLLDNKCWAIKQLKFRRNFRDDPYIINEIYCLTHLKHKNIVQMHEIVFKDNEVNIVMEYAVHENLERYMEKNINMEFCLKYKIYTQVLHGVEYCHLMDIAHRDLNPSNVLLTGDMVVKIADFGLAVRCSTDDGDPVMCEDYLGRVTYLAPEILQKKPFLPKPCDMWSLGVVLLYLLFHSTPFTGFDEHILEKQINETWKDFVIEKCGHGLQRLKSGIFKVISCLLELDPARRENICDLVRTWDKISPGNCFDK